MSRMFMAATSLALVGALMMMAACALPAPRASDSAASTAPATSAQPVPAATQVMADGFVVPALEASLSMPIGGIAKEVLIREGDDVAAGQLLVRLDDARQQAAVAQAEAALRRVQAFHSQLLAGPLSEEVAVAQIAVEAAEKQLERLKAGARPEEIAVARAGMAAAQAAVQKVQEGPGVDERIAAQADLDDAAAQVRQAQAAYDRIRSTADASMQPEALQLEHATNVYNAAKARLAALEKRVTSADIAQARARVQQAQAELDLALAPPRPADIAAAEVEVHRAQAQLALANAGARPEAITAAEADVAAAEAAVQQAKAALAETVLVAPFAGNVAALDIQVGEQVIPGAPVLRLADTTRWLIETDDLTELDVVDVAQGATAVITFDAIPDLELTGVVERIKPIGVNKLGDMTYTVVIRPDRRDPRLRWNMTATATID